jgi:Chaperone of endosialidase
MKNLKHLGIALSMVFVLVCFHASAFGQTTDDKNRIATVSASGGNVRWDASAAHAGATLTVSGPDGQVYRKEFKSGGSLVFQLTDEQGNRLPDGVYNYELRLAPVLSPGVKEELKAARAKGEQSGDDAAAEREMRRRGRLPAQALIQSGSFSIVGGSALVGGPGEGEEPQRRWMMNGAMTRPQRPTGLALSYAMTKRLNHATRAGIMVDQVIPDDLIVQGSLCVGFDCVNNESFGFDTIKLKENNLRIHFEDTSTGSYPSNDWQLTANDSASGGANKFSIEDLSGSKVPFTITAGAATNSIFVDSTGRLGLRTSTPVLDIHAATSNTPAIRLEQSNAGGFTAQTWDVAGNEANFFVRDVTGGSRLPFRIRPGAATSSIDINASSNVGIGTASASLKVDIKQAEDTFIGGLGLRRTGVNADVWALATGGDNSLYFGYANNASGGNEVADFTVFPLVLTSSNRVGIGTTAPTDTLSVNGTASKPGGGSWAVFSDERLKNIKGRFNLGLKAVMQLQPLRYEYRPNNALNLNSEGEHVGFAAQSLQKVIPEAVTQNAQGFLMVNNDPIIWTMLNAIKEQQQQIEQLKAEIQRLQPRAARSNRARSRRR